MNRHNHERGDTIVEVLISVAVASLMLSTAYAVSVRNVGTNQDTQEHNQAQQLAQVQIERMRALSVTNSLSTEYVNGGCITEGSAPSYTLNGNSGALCQFNAAGVSGGCAVAACYEVAITKAITANTTYEIAVKWTNVRGNTAKVSLWYGL